jgi:hypothetical protein
MADSFKTYTGDETIRSYLSPPEFIEAANIKAFVDGIEQTQSDGLTTTTFIVEDISGAFNVTFGSAIILEGLDLLIQRVTPQTPYVDFQNGSTNQARDLNTSYQQAVYIAIEAREQ